MLHCDRWTIPHRRWLSRQCSTPGAPVAALGSYSVVEDETITQNIKKIQLDLDLEMRDNLLKNVSKIVSIAAGVPPGNVIVVNIRAGNLHIGYKMGILRIKSINIRIRLKLLHIS